MTSLGVRRSCAGNRSRFGWLVLCGAALGALGCGSSFETNDDGQSATGGSATGGSATGGAATGGVASGGTASGSGAASSSGGTTSTGGASNPGGGSAGGSTSSGGGTTLPGECKANAPCDSGVCAGDSCAEAWSCVPSPGGCTKDLVEYCGCDGVTFMDSGTCPTRPYSNQGPCSKGTLVDCNPEHITCLPIIAPPECPEGQVYSVTNNCHGDCVPIDQCACNAPADCPNNDQYTCNNSTGACTYYLR
jgi:hypothetical protein